jgi:hypothetical protein
MLLVFIISCKRLPEPIVLMLQQLILNTEMVYIVRKLFCSISCSSGTGAYKAV